LWSPIGLAIAALINIALAFWLVPLYGGMGAAIATAIAYFFWNVITLILSERFWPVGYPVGIFGIQILIALLSSASILYIGPDEGYWALVLIALVGEYNKYMNRRTVVTGEK
jgi:O-antigen/teichoic acid export membrane protein